MRIGMTTDALAQLPLDELLPIVADMGLECVEFGCGNYSSAPHLDLDLLLASGAARDEFVSKVTDHGLEISALNCSGNPLKPGEGGKRHDAVVRKTFRLAGLIGLDRVVMMSGLPGGPGDRNPNWIVTASPKENAEILRWQWEEVAIPYWTDLSSFGRSLGIERIAIENHGMQLVHNVETLVRLREAAGSNIGANFDPSHVFWMGGDPLRMLPHLGDLLFHVHAKDTRIESDRVTLNTLLEPSRMTTWSIGHGTTVPLGTVTTPRGGAGSCQGCARSAMTTS